MISVRCFPAARKFPKRFRALILFAQPEEPSVPRRCDGGRTRAGNGRARNGRPGCSRAQGRARLEHEIYGVRAPRKGQAVSLFLDA